MQLQELNGQWGLRRWGSDDVIAANVPGCVHLDLMRAGLIDDPFYADNEHKVAWVHESDWEYSRSFDADEELLDCDAIFLECDGLDTIAEIRLNGELIAHTDNLNVGYRFDVTGKIKPKGNDLRALFKSPVAHVRRQAEQDPRTTPCSLPGGPYMRKAPCQWGWDWGPQLPTMGIWRDIRLAGCRIGRIDDLWVRQRHESGCVTLDIEIALERFADDPCTIKADLTFGGVTTSASSAVDGDSARLSIEVDHPRLWWPNGHGDQPLYDLSVRLESGGQVLDSKNRRIGLRTIELQRTRDEHGRGFVFAVNGLRIFAKGADWIPADSFPTRTSRERYDRLIRDAARANMNMLRVWGGGFYESEAFYDLCDQYGILVWQDCQFACGFYPADQDYLDNVRREVEYNVRRLRSRTCLALWCGNNEMEWQMSFHASDPRIEQRKAEYVKMFRDWIPPIVAKMDPDRTYWPSSPSSDQDIEPFVDPNNDNYGNGHFWDVWHGQQPFTFYRTKFFRFLSEFGFQSLPAYETVKAFCPDGQLNMTSHIMEHHQKNSGGNARILHYLAQTFRFPKDFEQLCYVSQLLQAEAIRYGVEHFRRNRDRCMGTLYWQLNDCWPGLSWASLDYFGRWKALHYAAKRFYEPVLVSIQEEDKRAQIHLTNDTANPVQIELTWSLEEFDGTVLKNDTIAAEVGPERDIVLADLDFANELKGDASRRTVLVHSLLLNGKRAALGITPFVPSKHLDLPDAKLTLKTGADEIGPFVDVTADKAARFVCVRVPGKDVVFSDNYFDLPAGRTTRVWADAPLDGISAHSLRDSY